MKKIINKVQIIVHKVLYKGHEGEKLRPEIYSADTRVRIMAVSELPFYSAFLINL
jgi:hypothetical protein